MIELNNLSFAYRRKHPVLSNITLNLSTGHIHGLLGCNGIGKTTLLKIVCGIMRPDCGRVCVDGRNPMDRHPEMLSSMFIVPEEFDLPNVSLRRYAAITAPFYPNFDMEQMLGYCRELNVDADVRLHSLSMGQRKKAYIAFALACNVRMLLLDEPTNGLDIPSKGAFRRLLAGYVDDERMVVISTHQVADVEQLIDNIVILDTEGVALNATTAEICSRLSFGRVSDGAKVLYRERSVVGDVAVAINDSGEESSLNIELLFNAATANRKAISELFIG